MIKYCMYEPSAQCLYPFPQPSTINGSLEEKGFSSFSVCKKKQRFWKFALCVVTKGTNNTSRLAATWVGLAYVPLPSTWFNISTLGQSPVSMQEAANRGLSKQQTQFFRLIKQRFATRYLGTFEFIGSQQTAAEKKIRNRKIRVSDRPPVCRMISAWLRKLREPGLLLQVMSFQRVLHWCRCSAQPPRELQGGFQAPEAMKRWHSTSGSAPAEVERVGAFFHLLVHALTLGTQT